MRIGWKRITMRRSTVERFTAFISKSSSGCWLWNGSLITGGYGRFYDSDHRAIMRAHRWSYLHSKGAIPKDREINHLCHVRACVNPDHLELVTRSQNNHHGAQFAAHEGRRWREPAGWALANLLKTGCKWGHAFTEANTYVRKDGSRGCRACRRRWRK